VTARKRLTRSLARALALSAVNAAAPSPPSYHVLQYKYVPDILDRRDPFRAEHLQGAKDMAAQRKIVMAGALTDPVDGAVFVFRDVTKEEIEAFVRVDLFSVACCLISRSTLDARRSTLTRAALRFARSQVRKDPYVRVELDRRCYQARGPLPPSLPHSRLLVCPQVVNGLVPEYAIRPYMVVADSLDSLN